MCVKKWCFVFFLITMFPHNAKGHEKCFSYVKLGYGIGTVRYRYLTDPNSVANLGCFIPDPTVRPK
jgi:hypothetical protein